MAKRVYSDDDKAGVLAILDINDGNVKRTARDTGVAEQTIRDWKKSWERVGVPVAVQATLPAALADFSDTAERIRGLMLDSLEAKVLNDELSGRDLVVGIGVLTDKLRISRGEATSRTETTVEHTVSPEKLAVQVQALLEESLRAGLLRDGEIVDAEWKEQAAQAELVTAPLPH